MYISQCLIVKNEEKNIERCLGHLKPIADEQIVVDTGSTDRTAEIAQKLGAKVFHFKWIDDFSAARNYAISKAKGDWIIFLDCDEWFNESSVPLIRDAVTRTDRYKNIDGIACELINVDKNRKVLSTLKNVSARIFKNRKNIRYKNKVHEVLYNEKNVDEGLTNADECGRLKIFHDGYDSSVLKEKNKNERNIALLKRELEENPADSQLNLYICKSLYMNGQYEEALAHAYEALNNMDKSIDNYYYCMIYSSIMNNLLALKRPYEEMKDVFDEAVSLYPWYPDYYRTMGLVSIRDNKIKEAIGYYKECIEHCKNYSSSVESASMGQIENVYGELLKAYVDDNNASKVVEISSMLLNANKYNYKYLTILIVTLLTAEKEKGIVQLLSNIYDYKSFKDKIYLIKACEASGNRILINYYKSLLSKEECSIYK